MPCQGPGPEYEIREYRKQKESVQKKLDKTSVMLCSACRALQRLKYDFDENPELSVWWDKHLKADQKREDAKLKRQLEAKQKRVRKKNAIEVASNKPVSKLTKKDKDLLKEFSLI
jgi:hypothetical protein